MIMVALVDIGAILTIILFFIIVFFIILMISVLKPDKMFKNMTTQTYEIGPPSISSKEDALINDCIDIKKLISFYFINNEILEGLYSQSQVYKENNGDNEDRSSDSSDKSLLTKLPIFSSTPIEKGICAEITGVGQEKTEKKEIEKLNPDFCCREVMRHLHLNGEIYQSNLVGQIYNPNIIDVFNKCCDQLRDVCHLNFSEYWLSSTKERLKKYVSPDISKSELTDINQKRRYILLRADFNIEDDKLKKIIGDNDIIFEVPLDISKTTKGLFNIGMKNNYTVFGIMNWSLESSTMKIIPIAIYGG